MQFQASLESLPTVMAFVRGHLASESLPVKLRRRIEIAVEEAVVNIMLYAYPQSHSGPLEIDCAASSGQAFEVLIRDWGVPFNPVAVPVEIDFSAPLEEREEGGLGIYFILEFMDRAVYAREGNANVLLLRKEYEKSAPGGGATF